MTAGGCGGSFVAVAEQVKRRDGGTDPPDCAIAAPDVAVSAAKICVCAECAPEPSDAAALFSSTFPTPFASFQMSLSINKTRPSLLMRRIDDRRVP